MPSRTYTTPKGVTFTFEKALGRGQFGIANAVKNRRGDLYCMKEISVRTVDEEAKADVLREVDLMRESCDHANIVTFYDSWFERNRLCILMEYCANGALDALISRFSMARKKFPYQKVVHYMQELAGALSYCHDDLRIMHRDLKPANVLIDDIGTLKLGDFGLAKSLEGGYDMCATYCGSPLYMSPELCSGKEYSFSTDVWALGCISYELMTLTSPWANEHTIKSYPALVKHICETQPLYDTIDRGYPSTLIDITRWMLHKDPKRRASSKQISEHLDIRSPPRFDASVFVPISTLGRQEKIVQDAHKLTDIDAAIVIQKSIRKSFRRHKGEEVLRPMDREPPPPSPRRLLPHQPTPPSSRREKLSPSPRGAAYASPPMEEESVARIQNAFRSSRNRFAAPSDRITRLATPRVPALVPTFRRVPLRTPITAKPCDIPSMIPLGKLCDTPRGKPMTRPAWV